jgi:hypothetical protein
MRTFDEALVRITIRTHGIGIKVEEQISSLLYNRETMWTLIVECHGGASFVRDNAHKRMFVR